MNTVKLKPCTLPETDKDHYLTGITALNIYSNEGTGDWHFSENFLEDENYIPRKRVAGVDTHSTSAYLGNTGVFNCYKKLIDAGVKPSTEIVYAADHYRAVADMLFNNVVNDNEIEGVIVLDDWLPEENEKARLYTLVDQLKPALSGEQWKKIKQWKMKN